MSTDNITCANCGKGEENSGDLKACTACKMVKYCNRECQIAHRPKHKKLCKKRAAELFDAALFEEHAPEECPICMLPSPILYDTHTGMIFRSCCGKSICEGCEYAMDESGAKGLCPFCKTPPARSGEEEVKRVMKLMEKGNAEAFYVLGGYYADGINGMPLDMARANDLYLKAGELGCVDAYHNLGCAYDNGDGLEINKKKARHYWELAAMNGSVQARFNLGADEYNAGNHQQGCKHLLIAANAGYKPSLEGVKDGYMHGHVTKDQYANTLREYQKSQDEVKSDARDKALTARNQRMGV